MITRINKLILLSSYLLLVGSYLINANDLSTICENKQKVNLNSISKVKNLINEVKLEKTKDSCKPYLKSFLQLEPILNVVEKGKTCNLDMVNMLRDYHLEFIWDQPASGDTDNNNNYNNLSKIPSPLRFFFISLCFQISAECKMTLINNLEFDTKENITDDDYKTTDLLEKYGVSLMARNSKIEDFDDILLLSELGIDDETNDNTNNNNNNNKENSKIMVKVKTNNMLKSLNKNCKNKFRPYYEKLILPLIVLSNLGYNYQGELLARELKELKENELIRRWYNIVQTCEAFNSFEIYEDDEILLEDQQTITLISKEEADLLKSKKLNDNNSIDNNDKIIVYDPPESHNSDELWIQNQAELEKLVMKYKASASETERIRKKLMKKMFTLFKESIKSGKFGVFVSGLAGVGGKNSKLDKKTNINEDMINIMDDVVSKTEETTIVNLQDQAVAFGGRHGRLPPRRPGSGRPSSGGASYIPARVVAIPEVENQSKLTTKIFNKTIGKLIPSGWNLFFWFLGIIGILLIIAACTMG